MKEKILQNRIAEELNSLRGCKAVVTTGKLEAGTPDIIGTFNGKPFAIETKVGNNQPSRIQQHRLLQWASAGVDTVVAREDFDAEEWVKQ